MNPTPFVSLHNHTEYSFLDGAIRINDLVARAKEFGMPAVAITDHGGLFGAVEFFGACKSSGIKPILGFEAYVAPTSRFDKTPSTDERHYCHLILLAKNNAGWKNLMKLSSIGYLEGFYYKPRIDTEVLRKHSEGIIATSACVAGAIPQAILGGDMGKARRLTEEYIDIFGKENFYFELQNHGIEEERKAYEGLIALGREMGVPFIVANDAHYLNREDALSHEVLLCIQTQTTMDDPKRMKFGEGQVYFKSPEEMAKLFPEIPEAMSNTVEIAERCEVDIKVKPQLPSVEVPKEHKDPAGYLTHLAREGLKKKYADVTPEIEERLEYELKVINGMEFAGYFLIVLDVVLYAHEMGVMVGCRGSAAGSLVFYAIGVTDVDPIKFDLLFERFLNPERISMPDADIDFADRDREKVIEYVVEKYGRDAVCRIINFGTMMAKMVVKDVARAMGVSVGEANKLSSLITGKTLAESIGVAVKDDKKKSDIPPLGTIIMNNELEKYVKYTNELATTVLSSSVYKEVFRHAAVLEGLTRQPGMHAGGVIIAPGIDGEAGDVVRWAPLFKQSNANDIMTQFDMNYVEKVGLVKMDFLGLRTLTVLQEAQRLVRKYHNVEMDLWKLPDDDKETLALFGSGETTGIFQFESNGMKDYLRKLKPTSIEDLTAMNALYRPGPMDNIDMFINRKYGREEIVYPHPCLESILNVTYGVIVYQEQVMRIAQVMGKFTMGQADILRKAMGKKQLDVMAEMGVKFVDGAVAAGIERETAQDVYDLMAKFGEYGFNKAHSAVYAHLSYQTAYIKVHYPLEYMTAYLAAYLGDMDEFLKMRNEAERVGIRMLPPDVNKSDYEFSIEGGNIRIGLAAVKNVGKAAESILSAREENGEFTSIFDVCKSTDNRIVNKKALESLICAGAFDGLGGSRAQYDGAVAMALEYGSSSQKERASGQVNLFDAMLGDAGAGIAPPEPKLPDVAPWPLNVKLQKEKDILGFYASGHPLDQYYDEIRGFSDVEITPEAMASLRDGAQVMIGGVITTVKPYTQKNGKPMAFATLESFESSIEMIAFADAFSGCRDLLVPDSMVLVYGSIMNRDEAKPKLRVEGCVHLSLTRAMYAKSVHINISTGMIDKQAIDNIHKCCGEYPGDCYLVIHVTTPDDNRHKIRSGNISMAPSVDAINRLRGILGRDNVWIGKNAS